MSEQPARPPSVDALARRLSGSGLPHPLAVRAARSAIAAGRPEAVEEFGTRLARELLRPVINGTGVLLHTNLGRAPLGHEGEPGYANLELDLATGRRGSRHAGAAVLLEELCGAPSALVVNNGAAALLLTLAALAAGRGVAVSRGEAVEIGGGFRVPEVAAQSGARLVDVGTTNRTRVDDYRSAVDDPTADVALVLKVHTSNFSVEGFTASANVCDLAGLGVPVVADLGSGLLDRSCPWLRSGPPSWLAAEPAVRQTLEAGADIVTFSADKLIGGPQAGLIVGNPEMVERCARHPLARALRPGGMVLEALQDVLLAHLHRDLDGLPFWQMACASPSTLRARAEAIAASPRSVGLAVEVVETLAVVGGGAVPGATIDSVGLRVHGDHSEVLRNNTIPIVARVLDGHTVIDVRTLMTDDDAAVAMALMHLGPPGGAAGLPVATRTP